MKPLIVALGVALAGGVAQAFEPTGCPDFTVELPRPGGAVVRAADYGFSKTNDFNTAAINRAIDACRRTGARKVVLEPGEYNCFDAPPGARRRDRQPHRRQSASCRQPLGDERCATSRFLSEP